MRMRLRLYVCVCAALFCLAPRGAVAQYRPYVPSDRATGETYHVEFAPAFWFPSPDFVISSESLGIPGDDIDLVADLGIEDRRFPAIRLVGRPATKHKFRFEYIPIKYEAETILTRTVVFNGIRYTLGLPVATEVSWKAYRFGYEYDFLYRDRWFAGFVAEAKYTDVDVSLASIIGTEFARARAPIPAIGGIFRGYVVPNISITAEVTGFKLHVDEENHGSYFDVDIYGTLNFTENVGVQGGYRSLDVDYQVDEDAGRLKLKGIYFGGVVRY